jgi:hypothetical protein
MKLAIYLNVFKWCASKRLGLFAIFITTLPAVSMAEIIWSGDFSTGDFTQWHPSSGPGDIQFWSITPYGRPIQYSQDQTHVGDGSLLSLVADSPRTVNGIYYPQGPTRGGNYAAKFTVKSSANGMEPNDCDFDVCSRRRTELNAQAMLPDYYDAIPYQSERWFSVSHYLPSDWDEGGGGFGITLWQLKARNGSATSMVSIATSNGSWEIKHRWDEKENPTVDDVIWQQTMFYAGKYDGGPYPRSDAWPDGLADFPDVATSHAALQSVNKGGWTDWVIHAKFDARGAGEGGTGFLTIWKREDLNSWVKVLHILPKVTNRGGITFDHGIGYNKPAGFGIKAGMYMDKDQVWQLSKDRVMYNANIKVGGEAATFAMMSPDGSSPGANLPRPLPPVLQAAQ